MFTLPKLDANMLAVIDELIVAPVTDQSLTLTIADYSEKRGSNIAIEKQEVAEMIAGYIEETESLLDKVDNLILKLEDAPVDITVVDQLFRYIHTVKGGASTFLPKATELKELAHVFETDLDLVRAGKLNPDANFVNVFLNSADLCRELTSQLKEENLPAKELVDRVTACRTNLVDLQSNKSSSAPPVAVARTSDAGAKGDRVGEDSGVFVSNEKLDEFMRLKVDPRN